MNEKKQRRNKMILRIGSMLIAVAVVVGLVDFGVSKGLVALGSLIG